MTIILRTALLLLMLVTTGARAHQAAIAIMDVTELSPGTFALVWENRPTEADASVYANFRPIWPAHCAEDADGALVRCGEKGLAGTIGFEGLGEEQSAAMLRIDRLGAATEVITLTPATPTARVFGPLSADSWAGIAQIGISYTALGIEHIAIGIDHLMFVLGLMLLAGVGWPLFRTITAFTLAHTVTLTLVSFRWIAVPENFVNAMIALSIVFIAVEIMAARRGRTTMTQAHPELVSFGFGLLHGLGFAGALVALGLPEGARLWALAAFNIGVEIGQLLFVFLVLALTWAWRDMTAPTPRATPALIAYGIGGVAAYWSFDRIAILFGIT